MFPSLAMTTASAIIALAQSAAGPTPEQLAWLKDNAIAFNTPVAGNGFDDLQLLKKLIGDARIVSLGECTHGTREVFQMKHRLVEFLATEMGFTLFSIEANMPEAYRLNDYVLHGKGEPEALIKGMYFWTWNTEEVLAMVEWMREFNQSRKGRIEFTGFDMQTPDVAMRIVTDFLEKVEPQYARKTTEAYREAKKAKHQEAASAFGAATGTFPTAAVKGKKIRFSGYIRTEDVTDGFAGLWWQVDGPSGLLVFDNMQEHGVTGTQPWREYEIELDVPEEAVKIDFGALMGAKGRAWFDDLKVEIDGRPFDPTGHFDFEFENDPVKSFTTGGAGYTIGLDETDPHGGKSSLRMESRGSKAPGLRPASDPRAAAERCKDVLTHLEQARDEYIKASSEKDADWAIQNARVVHQAIEIRGNVFFRDKCMAENVSWILDHPPADSKIVLWAHNGHVSKGGGAMYTTAMGTYLDKWYKEKMVVFGFTASEGKYTAVVQNKGVQSANELRPPPPDSIEAYCRETELPRFIVDLRKAKKGSAPSGWLTEPRPMRSIGALAMEEQFYPMTASEAYDALIYFEKTTASVPIKR